MFSAPGSLDVVSLDRDSCEEREDDDDDEDVTSGIECLSVSE